MYVVLEEVMSLSGIKRIKDMEYLDDKEYQRSIKDKDSFLICMRLCDLPTYQEFSDNLIDKCHDCGCDIAFRPYNKNATFKVCVVCGEKRMKVEEKKGQLKHYASERVISEMKENIDKIDERYAG